MSHLIKVFFRFIQKFFKFELISEKIQIFQKKGDIYFCIWYLMLNHFKL